MIDIDYLLYPIADALQMDMDLKNSTLYGETEIDFNILEGIPVRAKIRIVDSVVDAYVGTVGVILKVTGHLYLAMINDDRCKQLTFFSVDGVKAGFNEKFAKNGRLNTLDQFKGQWSRKKFYAMIAPGVRATYIRPSVDNKWELESVGPEAALGYLEMRMGEDTVTISAEDLNKKFAEERRMALLGRNK